MFIHGLAFRREGEKLCMGQDLNTSRMAWKDVDARASEMRALATGALVSRLIALSFNIPIYKVKIVSSEERSPRM